ncbi:acid-sensing ion channel 4-B [Nephila pilipes]|uniref:Acid-sensing ion channel 4-B n=1 Tax=Nephila pilipes TaxID=299642 RepID=A0A8X6NX50_NEPPI|nr:acid-sensing ion channel 4-B [Nephila pilipes]
MRKLFWSLLLVIGLIRSAYKSYKFINFYFLYPIVFTLEKEEEKNITFPAVSICNFNRIKLECIDPGELNSINEEPITGTPLLLSERRHLFQCGNIQSSKRSKREKDRKRLLTNFYEMDEETRRINGHEPFEFIKSCFFNRKICPENLTTSFENLRYGNCVTFNKKTREMKPLYVSHIGPDSGLVFDLYLENSFYSPITESFGARVVIHDPNETPCPEEQGFNVGPGYEISVSLRQSVMYRLPTPFRDHCVDYEKRQGSSVRSQKDCVRTCIQTENFAKCGCIDQTLSVTNNLKHCNLTNETQMCCLNDVLAKMSNSGPTCDCPQPCRSISYNEILSRAIWPSKACILKEPSTFQYFRKGGVRLNIFYSSLERTVYKQKAKFEGFELLSFLGCELGLWLGLSLLGMFDIFEKLSLIVTRMFFGRTVQRT